MSHNNQSHPPVGSISECGRYPIDLTGPDSHMLVMKPGVGSLSIGPSRLGKQVDLHVEADTPIDWTVFEPFATPAGSPWPRFLYYTGNDDGFFNWARERSIENMTWVPVLHTDVVVDASESQVRDLHINMDQSSDNKLHLKLPKRQGSSYFHLKLSGDLAHFSAEGDLPSSITLAPSTNRRINGVPFLLPDLGNLHRVTNLAIQNEPLAQPISLECLRQFPNLTSLHLWGNFCDLDVLTDQSQLINLELRFMADLTNMPSLITFPLLDRFIAYNVEESGGKRLRQQMKAREKTHPWTGYASVSQLRKPDWWNTEFGRPFSSWSKRLAKLANQAYDAAQAEIAKARSFADAKAAITAFTTRFNTVKGIETTEREDLAEAVWQLSQSHHLIGEPILEEMAQQWFDAVRDY
ncbi:hypothetical protein ACFSTH_17585 [Paenibacillus yanchengensis]|uniref:Uncharacterized protein n=1 Tax=Paenibacillus yanchengensis TaxID=2035833 RepID=A0ABW4YQB8_9BACL